NRYRELRPGVPYVPPPPYDKLDPRRASEEQLREALRGRRLRDVRDLVDGIGPQLMAAVRAAVEATFSAEHADRESDEHSPPGPSDDRREVERPLDERPLTGELLDAAAAAVRRVTAEPAAALR